MITSITRALCLLALLSVSIASSLLAQGGKPPEKPLPLETTRKAEFTTTHASWMSLDVSPDGKTIVFDLLGDLYTLPIAGGKATRLTSGPAFDAQPRYSPDAGPLPSSPTGAVATTSGP